MKTLNSDDGFGMVNLTRQNLTIPVENANQEIPHFTKDEVIFKLSNIRNSRDLMLFNFMWRTGCRVTEATSLIVRSFNLPQNEVTIRWLKSRRYEYRTIPLHKSLIQSLMMYLSNMKVEDRVFDISRQQVYNLAVKYGFDHPHKLRHSFAVHFLRQSKSPMALQELKELMGHSDIRITMQYLKIVPAQLKKSIEGIDFD